MRYLDLLPSRWRTAVFFSITLLLNSVFLLVFSPARWPYLWPQPAISIILGIVVALYWVKTHGCWTKRTRIRLAAAALLFFSEVYALHSIDVLISKPSFLALLHAFAIVWTCGVLILSIINQFSPRDQTAAPPPPDELPDVAAVIPTYGEPLDVLEPVIRSLVALDYPSGKLQIYISDDGHRSEVQQLAERYHVIYHLGARQDAKAGNLNSCLPIIHQHQPTCDLVLTQDADEILDPSFLKKLVGYFVDPRVAFVQTPKECVVPGSDPFGNRDRIFYDTIQPGRNGANAAFACGSGVIWRLSAVESIGGFNTWNIVEDMTTSYELHNAGYHSEYHNEILSVGLAPDDIPGLLKQRGTWAVDTWRMFLFNNPLKKKGLLSLRQRLQYTELGLFYVSSAFVFPLAYLVPMYSLLTGHFLPIQGAILFPWMIANILYYTSLAEGSLFYVWRYWQYWVGHTPTYMRAFFIALRSRTHKPRYVVTRKTRMQGFHGQLLWPQWISFLLGIASVAVGVTRLDTQFTSVITNVSIVLCYMLLVSGICSAAFYGVPLMEIPIIGWFIPQRWHLSRRIAAQFSTGKIISILLIPIVIGSIVGVRTVRSSPTETLWTASTPTSIAAAAYVRQPSVSATPSTMRTTPTPVRPTTVVEHVPAAILPVKTSGQKRFAAEHFDSPESGWPNRTTNTASTVHQDGRYQLTLNGQESISVSTVHSVSDYQINVDMIIIEGQAGLVFLSAAPTTFYRLVLDTEGRYAIEKQTSNGGTRTYVVDWTEHKAVRHGSGVVNRLTIERRGNIVTFFVNNQFLATFTVPEGDIYNHYGFVLTSNAARGTAVFDNLIGEPLHN